jgi:hypothetical protein
MPQLHAGDLPADETCGAATPPGRMDGRMTRHDRPSGPAHTGARVRNPNLVLSGQRTPNNTDFLFINQVLQVGLRL